jgi:hypothetical protein
MAMNVYRRAIGPAPLQMWGAFARLPIARVRFLLAECDGMPDLQARYLPAFANLNLYFQVDTKRKETL